MKLKSAAAAIALASLSLPTMLSADDGLKYEDLIHCAATNLAIAEVLGYGDQTASSKTDIDTYKNQAAALMAIASVGGNKETDVVLADTKKEQDVVFDAMLDKANGTAYMKSEVPKCKTMGEAAVEVLAEDGKKK